MRNVCLGSVSRRPASLLAVLSATVPAQADALRGQLRRIAIWRPWLRRKVCVATLARPGRSELTAGLLPVGGVTP
jgi:hypothetical protein